MSQVEAARIGPAQAGDADDVLDVWRVSGAEPSISDDVESIERLIAYDPGALILAEADGRLVGTVISTWDGWRGGIYRLAVVPAWRRVSLGPWLVGAADDRLRTLGAPKAAALVLRETRSRGRFLASDRLRAGRPRRQMGARAPVRVR